MGMNKKNRGLGRKFFSLLLALTMVLSMVMVNVSAADMENLFTNGDFETGDASGWTVNAAADQVFGEWNVKTDEWDSNRTHFLQLSNYTGVEDMAVEAVQTLELKAGNYTASIQSAGANEGSNLSSLSLSAVSGNTVLEEADIALNGWSVWETSEISFTLDEDTEVTVGVTGTLADSSYCDLDNAVLISVGDGNEGGTSDEDDTAVEADINVEKVPGLSDDFIMGMDISSVISEFNSGVTYQDFDGNIIDNVSDFCKFLAECGVTHVRVRVWNDPYDSNGNGYGGGDNDIETAVKIAEGCADAGLKMLVDFHCSDFWTDPSKQQTPKAWEGYTLDKKADALKSFLTDSLTKLAATGADIAMVQVGNETNNAFIGESDTADMCTLFNAGSEAIRAFNDSIKVVIHVTNPESSNMTRWAGILDSNNVDYDVLATSYYPSWHGTLANLKSQLQTVKDTYGKDVMVAETSYAFTLEDTDGHDNTIHEGNNTDMMTETQYPFTPQGQASFLRDVIDTVNQAGGLGVYYWESAWITVGDTTGLEGEEYSARVDANKELWEKYGSGWASSYSAQYDPDDAGLWYGGSAVDNQAMFDSDGSALASINVWKLVKTGAVSNHVSVDAIVSPSETIEAGEGYTLPEVVTVTYNSGEVEEEVSWNESDISTANPDIAGTYVINGTVTFSKEVDSGEYAGKSSAPVTFTLTVKEPNRIPADVAGFEVADDSAFTIVGTGINLPATDDPKEGSRSMHWYSAAAEVDTVTYDTPITLEPGRYTFEISAQGYTGDTVSVRILDTAGEVLFSGDPVSMAGWAVWQTPSISFALSEKTDVLVQIEVDMQAEGWGTADCMYLYRTGDVTTEPEDPAEPEIPADPTVPSTDVSDNVGQTGGQADKPSGSLSSEKETGNSTDSGSSAAPKTGVSENVGIWIFLLAAAGVAIIKYVRFTEKQKN